MGFNNSPSRGMKYVQNINSRFSEVVVRSQLKGLFKPEHLETVDLWLSSIKAKFEKSHLKPDLRNRYDDVVPIEYFWDNKPKRILLSKYKDYKGQDFFAVGMNYGVYIGCTIVVGLGGHDMVSRIIARQGLMGVWEAVQRMPMEYRTILGEELGMLSEAIAMESREVIG